MISLSPAEVAHWDQRNAHWRDVHRETCAREGHLTMIRYWESLGIFDEDQREMDRFCERCGVTDNPR